jgi:hypothetical protein
MNSIYFAGKYVSYFVCNDNVFVNYTHIVKCYFILPSDVFLITLYVNFMYTEGNISKLQCSVVSDNCI